MNIDPQGGFWPRRDRKNNPEVPRKALGARLLESWIGDGGPSWVRYGMAFLAVIVALLLDETDFLSGGFRIYLVFYPFILLVALYCGVGPGLLAIALSCLAIAFFWAEPVGAFAVASRADRVSMVVFIAGNLFLIWLCQRLRHAIHQMAQIEALRTSEEKLRLQEQQLRGAQQVAHVGSWEWDPRTDATTWSEELYRIFGRDPQIPLSHYRERASCYTPESWAQLEGAVQRALTTGAGYEVALEIIRPDDSRRWVVARGEAMRDAEGNVIRLIGTAQDITESKKAQEALRASEAKYRIVADNTYDWEFWLSPEGDFLYTSPSCLRVTGHTAGEFQADPELIFRIIHPDDQSAYLHHRSHVTQTKTSGEVEFRVIRPDGTERWVAHVCQPVFSEDGNYLGARGNNRDVTDRKQAEAALRESEAFGTSLRDSLIQHIAVIDAQGVILAVNRSWKRFAEKNGAPELASKFIGVNYLSICEQAQNFPYGQEAAAARKGILAVLNGSQKEFRLEYPCPSANQQRWFQMHVVPLRGSRKGAVIAHLDITTRKQAEEALRKSETELHRFIEEVPVGYIRWKMDGGILGANDHFLQMIGYSREELQAGNINWAEMTPEELQARDRQALEELRTTGRCLPFEKAYITKEGKRVPVLLSAVVVEKSRGEGCAFVLDLTERKQAEEALRKSQEQLRTMVVQAPITVAMFDRDMNYLATSRRWLAEFGRGHEDLTGLNHYDVKYDMPDYWREVHRKALAGEPQDCEEDKWVKADGTVTWLRWAVHPWRDAQQQIGGLIISTEDITKRKQAEDALKESEYRYAMAQRAANIGSWDWNIQTGKLHWSERIEPMFGLAPGQFPGTYEAYLNYVHPEDRQRVIDALNATLYQEKNFAVEHRIIQPDGAIRWVQGTGDVHRDEHDNPVRMFGVFRDITESKKAAERGLRLTSLIEYSTDFIGLAELDETPLFLNAAGRRLVGLELDAPLPPIPEYLFPEDRPFLDQTVIPTVVREGRWVGEFNFRHFVTQEPIAMRWDVFRIDDPVTGKPMCIATVSRDIRERKRVENERERLLAETRAAKELAEKANQAKEQFIAVLSHELRTPLTPVLATVCALEDQSDLSPELRDDMELVHRNVEMEAALIDDLLDVTRINTGKIVMHPKVVDSQNCLQAALQICENDIESKHLQLSMSPPARQTYVLADPTRLQQVFWNLLRNAVKFTPEGGKISIRSANEDGHLKVEIADTGIGIPPEVLPRVFNPFEQGEKTTTRAFGGLGLGLSIAKAIVDLHHGNLTAASEGKDKGATFTLELQTVPVETPPTTAQPSESAPAMEGPLKILLVEDHVDTLHAMARLLRRCGYGVTTATTVSSALEMADKEAIDLLISDLGLPDGSGLDIMRKMGEHHDLQGIALSGYGTEEDIHQSRDAGFAEHLIKPVSFETLRAAIQRLVANGVLKTR